MPFSFVFTFISFTNSLSLSKIYISFQASSFALSPLAVGMIFLSQKSEHVILLFRLPQWLPIVAMKENKTDIFTGLKSHSWTLICFHLMSYLLTLPCKFSFVQLYSFSSLSLYSSLCLELPFLIYLYLLFWFCLITYLFFKIHFR